MTDQQTFILGVGFQKAGTTWLWDYLNALPEVSLTQPKELHIFDAMLRPDLHAGFKHRFRAEHLSRTPKQKIKELLGRQDKDLVSPLQRVEMIENPRAYVEFFRGYDPDAKVVGEITPSYSTLLPEHFARIREWLAPHFNLRVVALLRDPVKRAFSSMGQYVKVVGRDFPEAVSSDLNHEFERMMASHYISERQDYERLLKGLDNAFDPGEVHVDLYERLFNRGALEAITDFLGVLYKEADFDRRRNTAQSSPTLDPALAARARALYEPIYAYCSERFGADVIEDLWSNSTVTK